MTESIDKKEKEYWGRRGALFVKKDMNCAMATLEAFQDMIGRPEAPMLKAFTSMDGGVVESGSTCGVITAGALGLALMHDNVLQDGGIAAEAGVMSQVREYFKWFEENLGFTLCRDKSRVDFYTPLGQIRYFLLSNSSSKCAACIRGAIEHLYTYQKRDLSVIDVKTNEIRGKPIHCSQAVLIGIKDRTGIGDPLLERLSFVFDGGIGFQGGVCGALVGAVMGLNLLLGWNVRNVKFLRIFRTFVVSQINVLLKRPIGKPDSFGTGKSILQRFREEAGEIECSALTGKVFSDWNAFQEYISSSDKCDGLIELAITEASKVIKSLT